MSRVSRTCVNRKKQAGKLCLTSLNEILGISVPWRWRLSLFGHPLRTIYSKGGHNHRCHSLLGIRLFLLHCIRSTYKRYLGRLR